MRSTPFINFGGMGPVCRAIPCVSRFWWLGCGHPTSTARHPGSSPKDPDPGSKRPSQRTKTDDGVPTRPEELWPQHKVAAADPLPEQGSRSPVTSFVIIQAQGCGGPEPSQWVVFPSRRDAICHMSTSAEPPSQPYYPNAVDRQKPGWFSCCRQREGGGGDRYPLDLVRPTTRSCAELSSLILTTTGHKNRSAPP
ncbi:hypothetical protein GGI35DRAFT_286063 [Trichoderma velutinum]